MIRWPETWDERADEPKRHRTIGREEIDDAKREDMEVVERPEVIRHVGNWPVAKGEPRVRDIYDKREG